VNEAFVLGSRPTLQQDVAYGLRQIVDIALKAISPAVNDPTTAVNCIDHLGVILGTLATRQMGDQDRADPSGKVRVVVRERTFNDLARLAFDQIRHYGAKDHVIVMRMLDTIAQIASVASEPTYLAALDQQADKIAAAAERELVDQSELQGVQAHLEAVRNATRRHSAEPRSVTVK
jgi:uncharacterized membrane protein